MMAKEDAGWWFANAKKERGVAHASLTRLSNRLKDLGGEAGEPKTLEIRSADVPETVTFGLQI